MVCTTKLGHQAAVEIETEKPAALFTRRFAVVSIKEATIPKNSYHLLDLYSMIVPHIANVG